MQQFAALLASAFVAASGVVAEVPRQASVDSGPTAEVYVAELDADWNVSREIRMPCSTDAGCAVDLGGAEAGATLHVRFDAVRGDAISVSSAVEDAAGRAVVQPATLVTLDRTGFGATHFDTAAFKTDGQRIVMMAVRVRGWVAPPSTGPVGGAHI